MEITEYSKGRTEKTVVVEGTKGINDNMVIAFAMEHADEHPHDLFGTRLLRYPADDYEDIEVCRVYLYTD